MDEYKEEQDFDRKGVLLDSLKRNKLIDFGKPNYEIKVPIESLQRCFELLEIIENKLKAEDESSLFEIKELFDNFSMNSDLIKVIIRKGELVQTICSLLNTENKELDDICIQILRIIIKTMKENQDDIIISMHPFADRLLYIMNEPEHFNIINGWLLKIIKAVPETATQMMKDDSFKDIFQLRFTMDDYEIDKSTELLYLMVRLCDRSVLYQRVIKLTPIVHVFMTNNNPKVIMRMEECLYAMLQIQEVDSPLLHIHGVDFYVPLGVVERIMEFIGKRGVIERLVGIMKAIVIRNIDYFFVIQEKFNILEYFIEKLISVPGKVFDNIFIEFLMFFARNPAGSKWLVESEKIPTILTIYERLEFNHRAHFYAFFLTVIIYYPDYMTEDGAFAFYFDDIVDSLTANMDEVVYQKFFEAVDVLWSEAYKGVMSTVDLENLERVMNDLVDDENENISESAKRLLDLLKDDDDED